MSSNSGAFACRAMRSGDDLPQDSMGTSMNLQENKNNKPDTDKSVLDPHSGEFRPLFVAALMGDQHQNGLRTLAGLAGAGKMSLGECQTSIKLLACCSWPFLQIK